MQADFVRFAMRERSIAGIGESTARIGKGPRSQRIRLATNSPHCDEYSINSITSSTAQTNGAGISSSRLKAAVSTLGIL